MARPTKHPKTGVYWLRKRVPTRLQGAVRTSVVKRSLRTKDPVEAKARFADALREIEAQWASLDPGSQALTHKQAVALAGEFYRDLVARHEDEPGSPETWQERIDNHRLALTRKQPLGGNYSRFARPLREWLEARGIRLEHEEWHCHGNGTVCVRLASLI